MLKDNTDYLVLTQIMGENTLGINDPEIAHQNVIVLLKPSYLQQSLLKVFISRVLFLYTESHHKSHFDVIVNCYISSENLGRH